MKRSELIAYVSFVLEETAETDGEFARDIVEAVIGCVIKALRADPGLTARTLLHWEAFFADASNRATYDLRRIDGLIQPREAIRAIEDFFIELDAERAALKASAEAGAA